MFDATAKCVIVGVKLTENVVFFFFWVLRRFLRCRLTVHLDGRPVRWAKCTVNRHRRNLRSSQKTIDLPLSFRYKYKYLQQHRQQVQQRRLPEQIANSEWATVSQRLRAKHQRQLQEFAAKGEEVKRRCESEFNRDKAKLRKQHEKRLRDVEANRQSIYGRMYSGYQQLRQRYMKRYLQKMHKKREILEQELQRVKKENVNVDGEAEKKEDLYSKLGTGHREECDQGQGRVTATVANKNHR